MKIPYCPSCGKIVFGGLKFKSFYLCRQCEFRLIQSRAEQKDYEHWIATCRNLWRDHFHFCSEK